MHTGREDSRWNRPFWHISDLRDLDLGSCHRHTVMYHSLTSTYIPNFV